MLRRITLNQFKGGLRRLSTLTPVKNEPLTLPNGAQYEQPVGLFINGEFVKSKSGKRFETENPTTETPIISVYEAGEADANLAVEAAKQAFKGWGFKTAPSERGVLLNKLADLIERDLNLIAAIETTDNGKVFAQAQGDVSLVVKVIRYYAGFADKIGGDVIQSNDGFFNYTRKEPLGVCGQIIPWNFPLLMWAWKIAPALTTGNTVVLKTAESTPLSALYACKLAQEAGFPKGVLNVISGFGPVGGVLSAHDDIKKIAFTGSTATGKLVAKTALTSNLKKTTMELGGKSPNIIFDDANLEDALSAAALGIFFNSGEVCCAGSRLFVQAGVYDKVVAAFKQKAESVKVGDPFDPNSLQGPQQNKNQFKKILGYIEQGQKEGAHLLCGGSAQAGPGKGYFIQPTVFTDVNNNMSIVREEIFGPVLTITKFDTVDDVIAMANDSEYGLAAGIHTTDINKAHYVAENIASGTIWVNCYNAFHEAVPFGGYKQSGFGKEMGRDGLENYLQTKAVRVKLDERKWADKQ
ncbi:Potassium-activated aldehyde dehydrogenase [Yarrowia sp. B02]|nr:Potassium-activated aldehyde dehydrogenase [Yarrowia sp. B02]